MQIILHVCAIMLHVFLTSPTFDVQIRCRGLKFFATCGFTFHYSFHKHSHKMNLIVKPSFFSCLFCLSRFRPMELTTRIDDGDDDKISLRSGRNGEKILRRKYFVLLTLHDNAHWRFLLILECPLKVPR